MSEAEPSAGRRELELARCALHERFEALRHALGQRDASVRVQAAEAFERALHTRIECERRVLLPQLAGIHLPGRNAQREIDVQHVQLAELARHVRERGAGAGLQALVLGLLDNLERRLAAHAAEVDSVYLPAIARAARTQPNCPGSGSGELPFGNSCA